ncbi:MAG: protein-glutamate O-methyltransferase CheR [Deltaproteobacteria bacterium]|nr:MAG: protein-glutamate O-methyltransferase CheR [Deltaproteobacteria bacterium]
MPNPTRIDPNEFRLMRDYIEKICGIFLTEDKMYLVETRLTTLMVESGCKSFTELYYKATTESTNALRDKIVEAITTNETFWFRDESPFAILDEVLFTELAAEIHAGKRSKIRIWSAACSTGQEPYSIAMTVLEFARKHFSLKPEQFEIIGTDISSAALYVAMAGRYDNLSITRGLPGDLKQRYFKPVGNVWAINDEVKRIVTFARMNLQENFFHLGKQDIIFCRYVLIYFADEFKRDILNRIGGLLRPDGYLFVGGSESIVNYTQDYQMLQHTRGLYYRVRPKEVNRARSMGL